MVGLLCLVSQCAKLHIAAWMWAVLTRVYLESCTWPMAIFTMNQRKEQQVCITFCTIIQQAFGDQSLVVRRCFNAMPGSRMVAHRVTMTHRETHKLNNSWNCCTNSRARPSGSTSDHSRHYWGGGNWLWDMPTGSDWTIGHAPCAAKFVPRLLTADQKQQRINIYTELRQLASDDEAFLSRVITGDESWVYGYEPETKQQSSQWKSPTSPRTKKGETGEKQSQEHDHHFLWHQGDCAKK